MKLIRMCGFGLLLCVSLISFALAQTYQEKHQQMLYPTVRVRTGSSAGSGTVLWSGKGDDGWHTYVMTNYHVIADAIRIRTIWDSQLSRDIKQEFRSTVTVEYFSYNNYSRNIGIQAVQADVVGYDEKQDIALLETRDRENRASNVALMFPKEHLDDIHIYDRVYAVGAALGHAPISTEGLLNFLDDEIDNYTYWLSSAQIIYGNCLPGDTMISMADGSVKPLKDIRSGDRVWSVGSGRLRVSTVDERIESGEKDILQLSTGSRTIRVSGNHPLLAVKRIKDWQGRVINVPVWQKANDLQAGDIIAALKMLPNRSHPHGFNLEGNGRVTQANAFLLPDIVSWQRIRRIKAVGREMTYDLKLQGVHNFFADGVLVHNSGGAVYRWDETRQQYEWIGIPSRVAVTWGSGAITHMGYFIPFPRIVKFLEKHRYRFIYDPAYSFKGEKILRDKEQAERERQKMLGVFR